MFDVHVRCNQGASVALTGRLIELVGKKPKHGKQHRKAFALGPVGVSVAAGKTATLVIKVPKAAVSALEQHAHESISFTLAASTVHGRSHVRATLSKLAVTR